MSHQAEVGVVARTGAALKLSVKLSVLAVVASGSAWILSAVPAAADDAQIQKLEAEIQKIEARHEAEIKTLQAEIRQLRKERPAATAAARQAGQSAAPTPAGQLA